MSGIPLETPPVVDDAAVHINQYRAGAPELVDGVPIPALLGVENGCPGRINAERHELPPEITFLKS
jgi:hypothetical protein